MWGTSGTYMWLALAGNTMNYPHPVWWFCTKPIWWKLARKKWESSPNRGENEKCWRKKSQIASPRKLPVVPAIPSAPPCVIAPPPRVFFLGSTWALRTSYASLSISTWPTCPLFSPTKTMAHKCRFFVLPPRDSCPNAPGSDDWCCFKTSVRGASCRILPSLSYSHARTKYQSDTWTFLRSDFTSSTPPQQTRRFLRVGLHSKQSGPIRDH